MSTSRKYIRFKPDQNTLVNVTQANGKSFVGLGLSEAYGGCGAVFVNHQQFQLHEYVKLKIGEISIETAEVRWIKVLNENVIEVGFEFKPS